MTLSFLTICVLLGIGAVSSESLGRQQEIARLVAPDAENTGGFAKSVAIDGNTVVVAASSWKREGAMVGAVYVYELQTDAWINTALLTLPDAQPGEFFGASVAVSRDTIVIGATGEDVDGWRHAGAVYVFDRDGADWVQSARITSNSPYGQDRFGLPVAIDGDLIAVAATGDDNIFPNAGAVYLFRNIDGAWIQVASLVPSDIAQSLGIADSIAIHGNTVAIGMRRAIVDGYPRGSVAVFESVGVEWRQVARLTAHNPASDDLFGMSISIDGDQMVVGAPGDDDFADSAGAATLFRKVNGHWEYAETLYSPEPQKEEFFGWSVAVEGDRLIASAQGYDEPDFASSVGAAYLFRNLNNRWVETARLLASDRHYADSFSEGGVGLSENVAVVGCSWHQPLGTAYLYDVTAPSLDVSTECPSDGVLTVEWSNATPMRKTALIFAHSLGSVRIPMGNACAGTTLGLGSQGARLVNSGLSGTDGSGTWSSPASASTCGNYLQIVDLTTCKTSDVLMVK